jgi:hypothetical protein
MVIEPLHLIYVHLILINFLALFVIIQYAAKFKTVANKWWILTQSSIVDDDWTVPRRCIRYPGTISVAASLHSISYGRL